MNIIRENVDALNAVLKVKVAEADYVERVENAIKTVKKRVSMPGFRPGMVPTSLVKKMHGRSILVDEINKLLNDELNKYIVEQKLDVLGQPLPKVDNDLTIDWDNQKEFEFSYDLALAPDFQLNFSSNDKISYYNISVDEKTMEDTILNIRRRYGKAEYPEMVEANDLVFVGLTELENGAKKEGGQHKTAVVSLEQINDEGFKSLLIGKKKEDAVTIVPSDLLGKDAELDHAFGFAKDNEVLKGISFEMKVNNVSRMSPSELNQELYDKVYGVGTVNGIEEFRAKVNEELSQAYKAESDKHFKHKINHLLMDKFNLSLPDTFLKRWIKAVNDKPISDEQIEAEYPHYANSLKVQLIENKIVKENDIKVSREEAEEYTAKLINDNFKRYGHEADENEIKDSVKRILSNEEEGKRIYEKLYNDKFITYYQTKLGVVYKAVTVEEFNKELDEHYKNHKH
jgi:trigger factor